MGVSDPRGKDILRMPELVCDLLNGGLCGGKQYFKPRHMERLPESNYFIYRDGDGKEKYEEQTPDVVYCYHGGAEFLSGVKERDRFAPVICVVFYYGEEPWNGAQRLHEMLRFPADFPGGAKLCPDYKINLIHCVNVEPDNFRTGFKQVFELLPYVADKKALRSYVEQNPSHFDGLDDEACDLLEAFLGFHALNERTRNKYKGREGYNVCTALENLRNEGIEDGMKKGLTRGREEASEAIFSLVAFMQNSPEDAEKIHLLKQDRKLRREMMEKYKITL